MEKSLSQRYREVREKTLAIVAPLAIEDFCMQPIPQVSPPKWHLAHTTWFFERLVLERFLPSYRSPHPEYYHLFNSYYKSLGSHWTRTERGHLSRPTVSEIIQYRESVDKEIASFLNKGVSPEIESILVLGLNHEQQHQELLYMDIKNIFSHQFGSVAYSSATEACLFPETELRMLPIHAGFFEAGVNMSQERFAYDNESPRHKVWVNPFRISNRLVSNAEYLEFVAAGGYQNPEFWLSDGWSWVNEFNIKAPLYWIFEGGAWGEFGLRGIEPLSPHQPVMHLSYYEAQAYARFKGLRLPTEYEWELVARVKGVDNSRAGFLKPDVLTPVAPTDDFADLHGSLWQWTQSAYLPYPGHQWVMGPLGEYNSKFMVNQMVLRGGCFVTEADHYRPTYRNYFYPNERWAFTGLRLAGDL